MPNELKPEDVMRALDILDKMDFFQGQRAGRELWNEKPFEVQEQDIADFSQGIEFVKNLITNALALLREKDADIEVCEARVQAKNYRIEELTQANAELTQNNAEKDAEIERLTKERDDARRDCAIAEQNHYECKKELEEMSDDILDSVRAERDRYKAESKQYQSAMLEKGAEIERLQKLVRTEVQIASDAIKEVRENARAEAITEFHKKYHEQLNFMNNINKPSPSWNTDDIQRVIVACGAIADQVKNEMKGATDGKSDL